MAGAVQELTAATFDEVMANAEVPLVVDLWAEWCPPCHALAPVLEQIAAEHPDEVRIAKVDVDAHPEIARRFDVMSFPTLLVFDGGRVVQRLVGARGKGQGPPARRAVRRALNVLPVGRRWRRDPAAACRVSGL